MYGIIAAEAALYYLAQGQGEILAEQSGQRLAILSITAFFVVGLGLLLLVNEARAREAALPLMMAGRRGGRIINISSIPAVRPRLYMSAYAGSKATVTSHPQEPVVSDLVERIPIGRLGLPEDVAKLVAFLSSDEAEFITGQAYNLTGWRELA